MVSSLSFSIIFLLGFRLLFVSAVPNVTVVPFESSGCSSWPGWIPTRDSDTTGSLQLQVDQADDSGVNDLLTEKRSFNYTSGIVENLIVDLRKSRRIAKPYYRCLNGQLLQGASPSRSAINIGRDNRNAFLTLGQGYRPEPYSHEINGIRQTGVFLGAKNQTTWGFSYVRSETCGELDYYEAKLLGLPLDPDSQPKASRPPDFTGFLKIVQY